jgi:hypothetical protein
MASLFHMQSVAFIQQPPAATSLALLALLDGLIQSADLALQASKVSSALSK